MLEEIIEELMFQEEVVEGMNATNETANVQRIVRTLTPGNTSTGQCYNCGGKGHYARNCPKPRVHRSIFMEQMMEEIEELSANICLMARIQPADQNSDDEPSYESAFIRGGNVNSGSVEKDTHVYDLCALETLARNAYDEAAKQQRFAQKVQQQNMTLTSQIEMYKERNRVLENITKDNNYLKEFLEADERAKRVQKQAESQLYRDRDIIRDLKKQQDKLSQEVKHFKQKNEELQQSHLILKRKMSENEDKYHDTILDLEEKLKKNVDLFLKIGNIEIPLNVRDSEETLEDAFKSQQKMNEKMNDPIAVANKQNCWTIDYKQLNALYNDFVPQKESFVEQTCSSSSYIPFVKILETKAMPSELPLINELFNIKVGFEKLFLLIKQNSKRASMFYTSKEEIALNDFCRDQVKPLLNELLDYFDGFQNLFQRDIKEMKDAFEQNDVYLDEIKRQNDFLKDQLLEASLKHDIELSKVCKIRTDNGTEFKNATLKAYYEKLGIMQQFSIARTPQQNGVVERRNHTLVEAARTMLIFSRLPEFLWAEAVATACFTQNRSIINTRHNKTPYELLRGRKPNVEYFHVFGSLCYPTNDRDDLGKMKPKADIGVFIGYSETSRGFRIYNRRTKRIMETIHVKFDELTAMASEHDCLEPDLQRFNNQNSSDDLTNTPSKEDLDNLFGPMFEDYFEQKSSDTTINSAAQLTHDQEDSPSTSSIIVDTHEAPPVVTTSDEQTSPISLQESDEFNQEDSADFDGNTQFVPYDSLNHEEIESSTTNLEPSNVQNFHQVQPSTHI
ncbi:retrovirus-related pol polyprotein from transposon TNT 1-94 [Tanacetum coccineum]